MPNNETTIRENAKSPKAARTDMGSAQQHDLDQQIMADRYLRAGDAVKTATRGVLQTKLSPPGTA